MAVTRIARVSFTSAAPDALEAFYSQALGFERIAVEQRSGHRFADLMGLDHAKAQVRVLRLGEQILELVAFERSGNPYPAGVAANDPRFQHIAIVVTDMTAAYARLSGCGGWTPITRSGPQLLPASSGGVSAFKFRDPERHPLELLAFPAANLPSVWSEKKPGQTFIGVDHSAITVSDTQRSIEFYETLLGFSVKGRSVNRGDEQQNLDDLDGILLEVTALSPAERTARPHLELLCYRQPHPHTAPRPRLCSNDVAATRLILQTQGVAKITARVAAAGGEFISRAPTSEGPVPAVLIRDPDGHAFHLVESA